MDSTVKMILAQVEGFEEGGMRSVWPDWAIYWTLGNFLKHLATIIFPNSPTFLGNFGKAVKIYNFPTEIIFRQLI